MGRKHLYFLLSVSGMHLLISPSLQMHSNIQGTIPLLVLNEEKKLSLFPMLFLHNEAPHPSNSASWTNVPCVSTETEFPLGKWVHVGCEVSYLFSSIFMVIWIRTTDFIEVFPRLFIWNFDNLILRVLLMPNFVLWVVKMLHLSIKC